MNSFLNPAARIMGRLRLSGKFLVAGAVALLLLVSISGTLLASLQARVSAVESKREAAAMMGLLVDWNKVLIESRRISITGNPGDAVLSKFSLHAQTIDKKLKEIEASVKAAQPRFDMSKEVVGLREGWEQLKSTIASLPADATFPQRAFEAHAPEYTRLYAFMRDLGNRSGLAQDPDADVFYLGYPLTNHTPATAGIAVRVAAYATLNVTRSDISAKDKVFYAVTEARLNDTFGGVETMLSQSMRINPMVRQVLEGKFSDLKARAKDFLGFVRENIASTDKPGVTQEAVASAAQPTVDAAWALVEANRAVLDRLLQERGADAAAQRNLLAGALLAGILVSTYLYLGMYGSIEDSVRQASSAARAIAAGRLGTVGTSTSKDEFADLVHDLRKADQSLALVIAKVKTTADSIAAASAEIAAGTQDLSARTEQAAANLEETSSSVEQLTSTVQQNANSASNAARLVSTATDVATQGGSVVAEVVETMDDIHANSKRITDIISTIDGISFQTNILALNAAVEAARAGEQGRGFAVVAGEVRTLAQRAAQAAKEIKALIGASAERVQAGADLVNKAGTTMREILASVQHVADFMNEITSAAGEQSDGIGQINAAVTTLDRMTQQNAALVEQSAAAAQSLREQASSLANLVGSFTLVGEGAGGGAGMGAPA
jgi:methyl-accepting chemotaxis protein